ncbi:MAG: HupE/UreJ family protein [Phycisphaerales bacterium]
MSRWAGIVAAMVAVIAGCRNVIAHPAVRCAAQVEVDAQRHATVSVRFDVLSFALNEEPARAGDDAIWGLVDGSAEAADQALKSAGQRLARHTLLRADGDAVPAALGSFPSGTDLQRWKLDVRTPGEKPRLPWIAEAVMGFELPAASHQFTVQFPEVLGDLVLAVDVPGAETRAFSLKAGERSPGIAIDQARGDERPATDKSEHGFFSFIRMGVEHIVPGGIDHVLFIFGLFLASPKLKSLLVLVTMFTLAHTVTLALAATGMVVAPPRVIEPLIALSIAAVAVENIVSSGGKGEKRAHPPTSSLGEGASERMRAAIVFGFGLVHGLGFASAFAEMELPRAVLVPALVGFNVGVEVGQLIVLCGAFVVIGWAARKAWYRKVVVIPASVVIACVGLYWAVTRAIGA